MYEESGCYDQNAMMVVQNNTDTKSENCFSQIVVSESVIPPATTTENVEGSINLSFSTQHADFENNTVVVPSSSASASLEMAFHMENENPLFNHNQDLSFHYSQLFPPDLLNLNLHFQTSPASSPFNNNNNNNNNSSISFENPNNNLLPNAASDSYDGFLHFNNQQQAPPPQLGYTMSGSRIGFDFGEGEGIEGNNGVDYEDGGVGGDFNNGVIEFARDLSFAGRKRRGGRKSTNNQFTTERQRRVDLSSKFDVLRDLIPNPSKSDRASVVGNAIEYIRELLRTVSDLELLVDKKRQEKQRIKRYRVEELATDELGGSNLNLDVAESSYMNEKLRSCWIQRKSKDTEVDVRIIDDEVMVKLVQRKKINCLVYASKVLDELNLDPQHVAGGYIGDFCSFMFNSKICEGSTVYASAIANKLIEVLDRNLAGA